MTDEDAESSAALPAKAPGGRDPLLVQSVEKAFRVLQAFDGTRKSLSLSQLVEDTGLDMSAAQRFTHTLVKLGYLQKDDETRRFELTVKALDFGYHYTRSNALVERALPYLLHISKTVEETVNLTVLDGTEIVFISRFLSRHVLNNDVVIGTRLPAYCTAPGVAILSRLPSEKVAAILDRSELRPFTATTTWDRKELLTKISKSAEQGYATAFEEYFHGDLSIAAAIVDQHGRPAGAINIAVSSSRYTPKQAEAKLSPLVVAAASSVSHPRR